MAALLAVLLTAAAPSPERLADGLAPEGPGYAAQGDSVNAVVRLLAKPGTIKLLLSDAQSDTPIQGEVEVSRFGPTGQAAHGKAVPGTLPGHYFVELSEASNGRTALVLTVKVAGRPPEILALDLAASATIGTPAPGHPSPDATVGGLLLLAVLAMWRWRRRTTAGGVILGALLASVLLRGGDARAHGPGGDVAPEPPGSQLYLAQELQFALGLRTALVELRSFDGGDATLAPRQYPAVPRGAVVERNGKKLVLVRLAPERFVAREVTLGWAGGDWVAVERGVSPGEHIVVEGAAFLRNGGAVPP